MSRYQSGTANSVKVENLGAWQRIHYIEDIYIVVHPALGTKTASMNYRKSCFNCIKIEMKDS